MSRPFLTARWESLVMLNYLCPPEFLASCVPQGTTLDTWQGQTLISLVGFVFCNTKLHGVPIPWHRTFEEVNLRFYVKRQRPAGSVVRGVVFLRELVPKWAVTTVARIVYGEPYVTVPMQHQINLDPTAGGRAEYRWQYRGEPFELSGTVRGSARDLKPGSEAEFITEHYWGFTKLGECVTKEYWVDHPRWQVWEQVDARFSGDASLLYGPNFGPILNAPPHSALIAVGSEVAVHPGQQI